MKQYHDHLKAILSEGTRKKPSREGMPGSISLFGYQNSYNLQEGFPILTTKEVNFKNIVVELLWFLRGETNIKYLVDNGCNIWNQDAYNYYCKLASKNTDGSLNAMFTFEEFVNTVKRYSFEELDQKFSAHSYILGDCGFQYGKVWRDWKAPFYWQGRIWKIGVVDQIVKVIKSLKEVPDGRRHIVTAIDPAHDEDLALYWCHCMFQFNTRELTWVERLDYFHAHYQVEFDQMLRMFESPVNQEAWINSKFNVPKYYLDCQLYQRSADMFLGVPYNISSYALLTHIIAKICNMVPGRFIHSFGDSHIYDNHFEQVQEILSRDSEKYKLPTLQLSQITRWEDLGNDGRFDVLTPLHFTLEGYESYPPIKAKLSTGLK